MCVWTNSREMTGCSGERGEGRRGKGYSWTHTHMHACTHTHIHVHIQTQTLTAEHTTHSQVCLHFFSSQTVRSYRVSGPNTETKTTILTQQHNNNTTTTTTTSPVTQKLFSVHIAFSPPTEKHCLLQRGDWGGLRSSSSKLDVV